MSLPGFPTSQLPGFKKDLNLKRIIIDFLLKFAGKNHSKSYKIVSVIFGAILFLVLAPAVLTATGLFLKDYIPVQINRVIELTAAATSIACGLYFLMWAAIMQWKIGEGTPAPNAPTRRLVITGPYKYCRNPVQLGAILYYFGVGIFIAGAAAGIINFILGFAAGSFYHKFIEEKELEERFGEEYRRYRKNTPFLFPKIKLKR